VRKKETWKDATFPFASTHALYGLSNRTKSAAVYTDLLTLWKDANRDIPVLSQAKVEYAARLNEAE